jgi:hypothetical protein
LDEGEGIQMKFRDFIIDAEIKTLQEASGFKQLPKGWDRESVLKFAKTLTSDSGLAPTEKGFHGACVAKMEKHFGDGANGFCAAIKDIAHKSTYWRGKGKSEKDVEKDTAAKKNVRVKKYKGSDKED